MVGTGFLCKVCNRPVDLEQVLKDGKILPDCCRAALFCIANQFSIVAIQQIKLQQDIQEQRKERLLSKITDAAIVSPDPEMRAAAAEYRKRQNEKDSPSQDDE